MTAVARGPDLAPATPEGLSGRGRGHRIRPMVVAVAVLLAAELAVRLAQPVLPAPASQWPAPELEHKYHRMRALAAAGTGTDVVLVGDSMMDAAGNADELSTATGLRVYNASVAGETLPTIANWTNRLVVPRLRPRTVVIGFSSNELNPAVLAPAAGVAAYRGSRAVRAAVGTSNPIDRADGWLRGWSRLYRYRDGLRRPVASPVKQITFDPPLTASGQDRAFVSQGYLQVGGPAQAKAEIAGIIATLHGFSVGPANVAILGDMIATLRNHDIAVLLVAMPVTSDLVSMHPGGEVDYQRAMSSFAAVADRSGATFVQAGVWPTSLFADPVHLNGAGAARFSAYLAPLLGRSGARP